MMRVLQTKPSRMQSVLGKPSDHCVGPDLSVIILSYICLYERQQIGGFKVSINQSYVIIHSHTQPGISVPTNSNYKKISWRSQLRFSSHPFILQAMKPSRLLVTVSCSSPSLLQPPELLVVCKSSFSCRCLAQTQLFFLLFSFSGGEWDGGWE